MALVKSTRSTLSLSLSLYSSESVYTLIDAIQFVVSFDSVWNFHCLHMKSFFCSYILLLH